MVINNMEQKPEKPNSITINMDGPKGTTIDLGVQKIVATNSDTVKQQTTTINIDAAKSTSAQPVTTINIDAAKGATEQATTTINIDAAKSTSAQPETTINIDAAKSAANTAGNKQAAANQGAANVNSKKGGVPLKAPTPISYEFNCKNNVYFEAPKKLNFVYYSVVLLFIMFVAWAYFSEIDEITRGDGKVIPSAHVKVVQSLDGGVISKFYVKEGDLVKAGQLLIKLDDTRFSSEYNQNYTQLISLIAEISRLKAQISFSNSIDFPKELNDYPDLKSGQNKLFKTIMSSYDSERLSLEKDVHLSQQELNIVLPLVQQGLMSQLERIRLEKQLAESKSKLSSMLEAFKTKAESDLADKQNTKISLEEKLKGLEDRTTHTEIVSPVEGYVHNFKFNTVGGVIKPGVDVLDIVPVEDQVMIESRINPRDRAFIRQDQPAVVKFPAYDSAIYGGLDGKVISISPDTEKDEKNNEFYLVRLVTDKNYLNNNIKLKIIPGMTANVSILTGKKRILLYILKPVTRIKEFALQER